MASYWEIAELDETDANIGMKNNQPRMAAYLCQQAAEKYLKSILEKINPSHSRLHSHSVHNILLAVDASQCGTDIYDSAYYLTSFYYNTRYPGDNYTEIIPVTAKKALAQLKIIKDYCLSKNAEFEQKSDIEL